MSAEPVWPHEPDPRWEVSIVHRSRWSSPRALLGWRWDWSLWWVKVSPYHGEEYRTFPVLCGSRPLETYSGHARSWQDAYGAAHTRKADALAAHFAFRKAERDARSPV